MLCFYWRTSAHNSERDAEDRALAAELKERLEKAVDDIVQERRYLQIEARRA